MAEFRLDRIRFRWKDIWQTVEQYIKDDIVIYEGKTYVALQTHTSGTNFYLDFDTNYWELMFDGRRYKYDWEPSTLENPIYYSEGDIVKWKGYLYRCLTGHTATTVALLGPVSVPDNWTIFATTYNWLSEWQPETSYDLGDVVKENGITYICTFKHLSPGAEQGIDNTLDNWAIVTRSDDWQNVWQTNYRYQIDDVVKYGGRIYRCVEGHTSAGTAEIGLEADQLRWILSIDSIEYKGDWSETFRYKEKDIVKYGHTLYICNTAHTSTTNLRLDEANWDVYVPGLGFEQVWDSSLEYQKGDIVLYGGYAYTALTNNTNSVPSVNGIVQDTGDWELLKQGYRHLGEWGITDQYLTGDVVRHYGRLYICITDSLGEYPDVSAKWQMLVEGDFWQGEWIPSYEYAIGDIVTDTSISYICILRHDSDQTNRPSVDIAGSGTYWEVLIQSTDTNVLTNQGDIRTFDTATDNLAIGLPGQVLKVNGNLVSWQQYEEVPKVYYVSIDGVDDENAGTTINAPFRTIKFACDFILEDETNRAPATVFIKTGYYEEQLPISVPADVALVGDELRSTVVSPVSSDVTEDMFYVRNGSGIRNMTLQGLTGSLGNESAFGTLRPTAGAYVGLDPGNGPSDTSVHIINKSPYVQNVTTFGTGCVGMLIDGALHNSGNRSIVANDFTQVLDDGIGYWATNNARSELVSVFTYFCYIGYLAENGGILRGTNGNNSYGTYGSRAEGVDPSETPKEAVVNNQDNEAQVEVLHNNGNELVALGYSHAGQNYTTASITVSGSGTGASLTYEDYRQDAIARIRVLGPADSSIPGGLNYQYLLNTAQQGTNESITLSGADLNEDAGLYVGQRVTIVAGKGIGQYGIISSYDPIGKVAIISKEYNGTGGWENLYPGRPIETTLDATTRYSLEPRVIVDDPGWTATNPTISWPSGFIEQGLVDLQYVNNTYVAINGNGDSAISTNGTSFTANVTNIGAVSAGLGGDNKSFVYGDSAYFLEDITDTMYRYSTTTSSWASIFLASDTYTHFDIDPITGTAAGLTNNMAGYIKFDPTGSNFNAAVVTGNFSTISGSTPAGIAYGNGTWVALASDGDVGTSLNAITWTETASVLNSTVVWTDIAYGNGRFVAVGRIPATDDFTASYSFDGVTWYTDDGQLSNMPVSAANTPKIMFQNGQFIVMGNDSSTSTIARSRDGWAWKFFDEDSTTFTIAHASDVYTANNDLWSYNSSTNAVYKYASGANAVVRAVVESSRVSNLIIYDPGANYSTTPNVTIFDNQATSDAELDVFVKNGVLPQPVFANRGSGYLRSSATISGNGFAELYQTGSEIKVTNLDFLPGPGANITFETINDVTYSLSSIKDISGASPNYTATLEITPSIKDNESPIHGSDLLIRERYSQVRLTGHDFLDIGSGNVSSTRYPQLYLDGVDSLNEPQQQQEVTFTDGGRVFYTSTDQDGNFRVGELFEVEQATGVVTVNADYFDLQGLTELTLGGIQVGGSTVVIREFSKEQTFVANSNNIVPTQRAIIAYLESRISSGGANAITNKLTAGQVVVGPSNKMSTTSNLEINVPVKTTIKGGADGHYLATMYYTFGSMVD